MDPASVPASAAPQPTVLASQPVPSNAANTLPTPATVLAAPPAAPQPAIVVAAAPTKPAASTTILPPPLPPRASVANPSSVNLPPSVVTQVSALVPPQAPPPPVLAQPPVVRHPSLAMPPPPSNQPPLSMAPRPTTVLAPPNPVAPVQTLAGLQAKGQSLTQPTQPSVMTMLATCPANSKPGDPLTIVCEGRRFALTIPAGAEPERHFVFRSLALRCNPRRRHRWRMRSTPLIIRCSRKPAWCSSDAAHDARGAAHPVSSTS